MFAEQGSAPKGSVFLSRVVPISLPLPQPGPVQHPPLPPSSPLFPSIFRLPHRLAVFDFGRLSISSTHWAAVHRPLLHSCESPLPPRGSSGPESRPPAPLWLARARPLLTARTA
jgi:hypothetical protein